MKLIHQLNKYITVGFIITIITVVLTSYFTFKEIINTHNKQHREAIIPLFAIVNSEIIRPLTLAKFMANNKFAIDYVTQDTIDEESILSYLKGIATKYNMVSFIAIDKHDVMLSSSGKRLSLDDDSVEWYHRLKALPSDHYTDIGNAENPHIYFDNKLFDAEQNFVGFSGVGIDLDYFAEKFASYRNRFGFEILFVDENNNITLSSNHLMITDSHHRSEKTNNISSLTWFKDYQTALENNQTDNNILTFTNQDHLVSQLPLKELNWRIFILSPPQSEQNQYWLVFLTRFSIFLVVTLLLYFSFIKVMKYVNSRIVKDSETDYLTQLPNRSFVHWKFEDLAQQYDDMSVVVADIDNFKIVNDTHGHLAGDDVLKAVAKRLSENLRNDDISGRWGGEEFILLLPKTNAIQAKEITERIRLQIAKIPFTTRKTKESFNITVSFGISHSLLKNKTLKDIIANADEALYTAKSNGRNQVVINTK